ncbi:hypothetical protein FPV67DRAFT_1413890 [Lyophyllum atratum]|nr:hypothetical protein FPV67DRAFT_1413890 [Lyophyllum atratum]
MLICRIKYARTGRQCIAWAPSRSLSQTSRDSALPRHEILTLLHKTTSLLPRVLASKPQTEIAAESLEFWKDLLSRTYDDLLSKDPRPANITVYGLDEWSGSQDLVTALLEEPLTSDESLNEQIRSRWKKHAGQASLTISSSPASGTPVFHTSSSFLQQYPVPLQIIELHEPSAPTPAALASETCFVVDERTSDALLKADIAIVVCNPLTTPLPVLLRHPILFRNPNTLLVLTTLPPPPNTETLKTLLSQSIPCGTLKHSQILFVDPSRAMGANEVIKSDSRSSASVQRYQDDFVGSRVSTLTDALKEIISSGSDPSRTSLRVRTSLAHIQEVLSTCQASLKRERSEMDSVSADVSALRGKIEEAKTRAQGEVLGRSAIQTSSKSSTEGDVVADALQQATKEMKVVMDRLTWWRMAWRVDEISLLVSQAVHQAWCRDLEQQLILQTGRLSVLQDVITKSIFALQEAHPTPPYNSAVLRNSLRQLAASRSFHVAPDTLTHPIKTRRTQIIEYPTTRLHVAGQRAVLGMSGGVAAGAGISWAGWYGWLTGSGEGLLGALGLDAGTAMGVGLLGAVICVRWGVGKWERSKRRWWEDWNRVGEGLGRDLRVCFSSVSIGLDGTDFSSCMKATLDQTMREKVLVVASTGCERLSDMVAERRGEIEEIEDELETLKTTLNALKEQFK